MENQTVESQIAEGQKLSPEEVSDWAAKAVAEVHANVRAFRATTPEERKQKFLSKGFPPELFTEPTHFLFQAEMSYKAANVLAGYLFQFAVAQNFKDEYKTNIFVQFMRYLTWDSFKKSLIEMDVVRRIQQKVQEKIHGTVPKAPKRKRKHTVPFWFRNFNKQPLKEYIPYIARRIRSNVEDADNYVKMYIKAITQNNVEEQQKQ